MTEQEAHVLRLPNGVCGFLGVAGVVGLVTASRVVRGRSGWA